MKIPVYIQRYPLSILWKLRGSIFRTLRHPRRLLNIASFYLSSRRRKARVKQYPFFLTAELSGNCNLKCTMCARSYRASNPPGNMSLESFKNLMEEMGEYLAFLLCFGYGESLLNPQAFSFIREAKKRDIFTVMATNACLLTPEKGEEMIASGLDVLVIGLDAITPEIYQKRRIGGDFEQVIRNIKRLVLKRAAMGKPNPIVDIQFLAFKDVYENREKFQSFVEMTGADKYSIRKVASYGMDDPVWSTVSKDLPTAGSEYVYDMYRPLDTVSELSGSCDFPWRHVTLTYDGNIIPCCKDVHSRHVLGNVFRGKGFKEVWNDEAFADCRAKMMKSIDGIDICRKCNKRALETHFVQQ